MLLRRGIISRYGCDHFPEIASLPEERGHWQRPLLDRSVPRAIHVENATPRVGEIATKLFHTSLASKRLPFPSFLSSRIASCESLHVAFTRVHAPTRTAFQSFLSGKSASRRSLLQLRRDKSGRSRCHDAGTILPMASMTVTPILDHYSSWRLSFHLSPSLQSR